MTVIELSTIPPSVNHIWAARGTGGARRKSDRYAAWRVNALKEIMAQRPTKHKGPVSVVITMGRPDRRRRDLDNYAKGILDAATEYGVIEDDSLIQDLRIRWSAETQGCRIVIAEATCT